MMNQVMQRPMFRQQGSPMGGEQAFMQYLQTTLSPEQLQSLMQDPNRDQIIGQLYQKFMSEQQAPSSPMVMRQTGSPEMGEKSSTFVPPFLKFDILDKLGVISNKSLNREVPDKDYQINLDDAMTNPQLLDTVFEMITNSTDFDFDTFMNMGSDQQGDYLKTIKGRIIFGKAEGGEMKSDAVGIADGLDQEEPMTADRDPSQEGIAKVSPEQYVQLMNEVRGDEVPMEGRVQELAGVVGEKDATDTPLSVLALVQPVFELQEQKQQGIANAPQGQQMMAQGPIPSQGPMPMANGGIVHLANGPGEDGVYSGMVGPLSLDQIQNLGLYTKPQMSDLGVASYTAGAGDVLESGSPEAILTQLSGMVEEPKTFAEILAEKQGTIGGLGLFEGQKDALKLPFLSQVTNLGLDIAKGEDAIESALNRFNQATNAALPMALKIKQQEKQLPLQLALSEYSTQKSDVKDMKKFVLGKSFDLALANQKNQGVGTIGVVGTNNEVIDNAFGEGVSQSLPVGTIVQKNTSGVMSVIKPDKFKAENLITVTGTYVTNKLDENGRPIVENINTVIDLSTETGKAEFDMLKQASQLDASQLIFKTFFEMQPTNIIQMPEPILNEAQGGEIVKRSNGTDDNPIGGEVATSDGLTDIMSNEAFADLKIDPFAAGPGKIDITKLDGSNRILGLRHNTGYETLAAIEDLVLRTYTQPQTVGVLGGTLRGIANISNTVDELLSQLIGKGLPESFVYNNPELQQTLEDMMKIPKLIAEVEAGASRYRATSKDIDKIAKERLDYGALSSASSIRKSLMAVHKSIFDKMNTYRDSLGQGSLEYKEPEIFNEEYGSTLEPKEPLKLPSKEDFSVDNLQSTLLEALPNIDVKKYPQLLTDPIFTGAIYSISQGATVEDIKPKFLELFNEKYGTGE
jgi:hypothetical protein